MPLQKLRNFLDENKARYIMIVHSPAYTAQEVAASAHVSGKELAKTVILKLDGKLAMCVMPAHQRVDFEKCKEQMNAREVQLANEEEFKYAFPGCEIGAMPPFGNLYDMPVFVCEDLTKNEIIAFNAGSHRELIKLRYRDFEKLVKPKVVQIQA